MIGGKNREDYRSMSNEALIEQPRYPDRPDWYEMAIVLAERLDLAMVRIKELEDTNRG